MIALLLTGVHWGRSIRLRGWPVKVETAASEELRPRLKLRHRRRPVCHPLNVVVVILHTDLSTLFPCINICNL
ncbi:unnamed protein product [Ixodes persulcatus]